MRRFFACSVGEPNMDYDDENLERIIQKKAFILHEDAKQKGVYEDIKSGDILLLKYKSNFIGYGETTGKTKSDDLEWNLFAPVIEWFFFNPDQPQEGISYYGIKTNTEGGGVYGTVKELSQNFAIDKMREINAKCNLFLVVSNEIITFKKQSMLNSIVDLLKYKKQIILQGPPGTGKTRLAQMIADQIIKSEVMLTPLQYVDWFIKNFKSTSDLKSRDSKRLSLLNDFVTAFPISSIHNLTLDSYSLGRGSQDSFCYWLEKKLSDLGRFSPGLAGTKVYGVYFSQDENKFVSVNKEPDEKLNDIKSALHILLTTQDYTSAALIFRKSFILKILSSYFPYEYFPIFSQSHLKLIAQIFEINYLELDDIQLNRKINEKFLELKNNHSSVISSFDFMEHLYDKFKIKDDNINLDEIRFLDTIGEKKIIQFHPAYTYEDFVRGITADISDKGQVEYKVENKTLAEFAQKALDNQSINYVLIIDEINRANLPSVLGELIYALEYRYNPEKPNENLVESVYSLKKDELSLASDRVLRLPNNLFIIGTMNTADRSVGHIDYAIRRRFAFVDILPDLEPVHPIAIELFKVVSSLFIKNLDDFLSTNILEPSTDTLSSDFRPEDVWIGHSYFICKEQSSGYNVRDDEAKLLILKKLKYEVLPILKEYIKDGILQDNEITKSVLQKLILWN